MGGFISASVADNNLYGDNISSIFPGRGDGRTAVQQGLFQLAALCTTLGISICGGSLTGVIIKYLPEPNEYFEDEENWGYEEVKQVETANIDNTL